MAEVLDRPEAKEEKRVVMLNPQRRQLREQWRQDWVVNAEEGTTIEDVLDPAYWAHVAADMQPYDRVEVLEETGAWMLDLLVVGLGRNWAKVHVLAKHQLTPLEKAMADTEKYDVVWKGPQHKFSVIRKADNQVLQDGFGSKAEGQAWAAQHEKVSG